MPRFVGILPLLSVPTTLSVLPRLCLSISDGNIVRRWLKESRRFSLIPPLVLKKGNALFYRPFGPFFHEENPGEDQVANIEFLIAAAKWYEARQESAQLIQTSLDGLRYLQT